MTVSLNSVKTCKKGMTGINKCIPEQFPKKYVYNKFIRP